MDQSVEAVLDRYHQRMREERNEKGNRAVKDSSWFDGRLLAIGPDTGRLVNVIARSLRAPQILEIGTSYGYSTLWLAEAARAAGGRVTTMELQGYKADYARQMLEEAGLAEHVDFRVGDALEMIGQVSFGLDFVLLDLWKNLYEPCLELFFPKLNPGAIIVADNMMSPASEDIARYARAVHAKPKMSSILLPVGQGIEISRLLLSGSSEP